MPTVEKVSGPRTNIRDIGHFSRGDRADVSEDDVHYLCEERGDFERVSDINSRADGVKEALVSSPGEMIDAGVCPWCDDYEGDHVGRHASSAHPDEWGAYTDTED
jgi:hypothetical protein